MPSIYKGRTKLGKNLNEISNKTDSLKTSRLNTKDGIIVESIGGAYVYKIRILKIVVINGKAEEVEDFVTGPMSLSEPISRLASEAQPEDLVGARVSVQYFGDTVERGIATLINGSFGAQKTEETLQANQLIVTGVAFASPGVSLI
jgi:hypothetical protein